MAAERIAAVGLILRYGSIDGAHHKQWVLDQTLRLLLGTDYDRVIKEYGEWDEGIAP